MRRSADIPPQPDPPEAGHATRGVIGLDRWAACDWRDGVSLDQLSGFDRILVTTEHHTYEIVVTSPLTAGVQVRGGLFFPTFTTAHLAGSSLGGSFLKTGSIHVGFRLQFDLADGPPIITSRVRAVRVIPTTDSRPALM